MRRSTLRNELGDRGRLLVVIIAIVIQSTAAFSQQEVDPTWHDPWARSNKVVTETPTRTANHRPKPRTKVVSRRPQALVHSKATRQTAAVCQGCNQSQTR